MTKGLIDSCILISFLREEAGAEPFLSRLLLTETRTTHLIVAAEVLAGARDKREQEIIDSFLRGFLIISPNETDGLHALDLYRQTHLSHGVDWPDCLIAATALRLGLKIYTQNLKHFSAFARLEVVQAF